MSVSTKEQTAKCSECKKQKPLATSLYYMGRGNVCIDCIRKEWNESYGESCPLD